MDAVIAPPGLIRVCVPGTPKPQERNRHRIMHPKGGPAFVGNYLPTKSRNEQAVIRDFAKQAMTGRIPFEGPLELRVGVWLAIPTSWSAKKQEQAAIGLLRPIGRPDLDNYLKLCQDALKAIVWRDDSQVVDLFIGKRYSLRPELIIEIRPI